MNFQEIREKSWSSGNGSALRAVTDQIKVASKTFALSRQIGGECWKMDCVSDCYAVKVKFLHFVLVAS